MPDAWDSIANDPEFLSLPSNEKDKVRLDFFHSEIAPHIPAHEVESARTSFFKDTQPAPAENPDAEMLNILGKKFGLRHEAFEKLNAPIPQQILQGMTKGATLGIKSIPGVPEPGPWTENPGLNAARLGGELVGGAGIGAGLGAAVGPLAAPLGEAAAGVIPEAAPAILRKMAGPAVENAVIGGLYGGARLEGETHGAATPGDVAAGIGGGAVLGAGMGAGLGAIKAKFPGLFVAADEAKLKAGSPQPAPEVTLAKDPTPIALEQPGMAAPSDGAPLGEIPKAQEAAPIEASGSPEPSLSGQPEASGAPAQAGSTSKWSVTENPELVNTPTPDRFKSLMEGEAASYNTQPTDPELPGYVANRARMNIERSQKMLLDLPDNADKRVRDSIVRSMMRDQDRLDLLYNSHPAQNVDVMGRPIMQSPKEGGALPAPSTRAGNINIEKLSTSDAAKAYISQIASDNPEVLENARRGKQTFESIANTLAPKVGMNVEDFIKLQKGSALNAEQLHVAEQMMVSKTEQVLNEARRIAAGDDSTATRLRYELAKQEQFGLQKSVTGAKAEIGRALSAQRMIKQALMSDDQRLMNRALEASGGRQLTDAEIKGLAALPKNDPESSYRFLANMSKPGAMEHVQSYFINGILSGPTSIGKVGLAGTLNNVLKTVFVNPLRAAIDLPVSWLQGRPREFYLGETLPSIRGAFSGVPQGFSKALYMLKNGVTADDVEQMNIFNREVGPAALNLPTRAHRAAYEISGTVAHQAEFYAAATREATKEAVAKGISGDALANYVEQRSGNLLQAPSDTMLSAAEKARKDVTFTTPHGTESFFGRLKNLLNWTVDTKAGPVQPLKFLQPFVVVPGNIIKQGFAYSPGGAIKAAMATGPQVSEDLAKSVVGSSALMAFGSLYAQGKMWGAAPKDPAARDAFFRKNKIEYGVRVGNEIIAYDKLEPISMQLKLVSNVLDAARNGDIPDERRGAEVRKAVAAGILDTSQTSGLFEMMKAVDDPDHYGKSYIGRFAQAAVPYSGAMRNIAQTIDPTVRAPGTIAGSVKSIIPGLSQSLPAKTDLLGRPIVREGGTLQPIKYAAAPKDPYQDFLTASGVKITAPGSKLGDRTLDKDTKNEYIAERGKVIQDAIDRVKEISGGSPNEMTRAILKAQISHAEASVREKYHGIAEAKALGLPSGDEEITQRAVVLSKMPWYKKMNDDERRAVVRGD